MNFQNRTAIVTGGTSGIGESTVRQLLEKGATVLVLGRNAEKGKQLEALGNCKFYSCDVADPASIESVCSKILEAHPTIDILVNNAGMSLDGTVESLTLEEWNRIFAVNVTSIYLMSKYIVPAMRKNGYGRIINIGSTAGTVGAWGLHAFQKHGRRIRQRGDPCQLPLPRWYDDPVDGGDRRERSGRFCKIIPDRPFGTA